MASQYGVMSIPTMMIFINGQVKETIIGAVPQKELEDKIENILVS